MLTEGEENFVSTEKPQEAPANVPSPLEAHSIPPCRLPFKGKAGSAVGTRTIERRARQPKADTLALFYIFSPGLLRRHIGGRTKDEPFYGHGHVHELLLLPFTDRDVEQCITVQFRARERARARHLFVSRSRITSVF